MANSSRRARHKRAAWASLAQVGPQTWRIRYWAEGPDGYKRRSKTIRNATRKDAERVRSELMLAHGDDAPCPTVGEVWQRWHLPALERRVEDGDLSPQTLRQYASGWNRHAAPRWASVPCDQVRPLQVQQWLDALGRSEAESAMTVLKPLLDYAVRYGEVPTNPFRERYVMPGRSTVRRRDAGVWTLPELGEVWRDVALRRWWEAAFLLAGFGGLRVGESLGVRSEDVSVADAGGQAVTLVEVRRQVANRGPVTDVLKNSQSRRVVAIPGRAGARLAAIAGVAEGGWLTGDGLGGPSSQKRLSLAWSDAMSGSALSHPFHNLRNSWQTNMRWTLRLPPWLIEPMMGHVGGGVTERHYDRPQAEMFAEAVASAYAEHPFDAGWTWAI